MLDTQIVKILQQEMVPALGCTEPIAIAYAAALVTKYLGHQPEHMLVQCSANIVKNVKSVIVPNSGGMKGIDTAAILGAYAGNPDKKLEVLAGITAEQIQQCQQIVKQHICDVELLESPTLLHIVISGFYQGDKATVEIKDSHTHVTRISKNDELIYSVDAEQNQANFAEVSEPVELTIEDVIQFARFGDYAPLTDALNLSISYNSLIAKEGLENQYGLSVGKTILLVNGDNVKNRARAYAAAGSDARMNGCDLPVMISSGSGNQGLTVSLPIIEYAKEFKSSEEQLHRALIFSNLVAIYAKQFIGKLSAYCGVVCAASGVAAGITYLMGGDDEQIKNSVTNTLGTLSGIVCDGAKSSCASKIATSVETAIFCHELAMHNKVLKDGDGIIKASLDSTVKAVGRLAVQGMRETDQEILNIMLNK